MLGLFKSIKAWLLLFVRVYDILSSCFEKKPWRFPPNMAQGFWSLTAFFNIATASPHTFWILSYLAHFIVLNGSNCRELNTWRKIVVFFFPVCCSLLATVLSKRKWCFKINIKSWKQLKKGFSILKLSKVPLRTTETQKLVSRSTILELTGLRWTARSHTAFTRYPSKPSPIQSYT